MGNQNTECSGSTIVLAFLGGALVGAIAGILFAPKLGAETRRAIKGYADKTEEEILEKAKEAPAVLDETIERSRTFIAEKKADVEAAIKAGRGR